MAVRDDVVAQIETEIEQAIAEPGLYPALVPGAVLHDTADGRVLEANGTSAVIPASLQLVLDHPGTLVDHPARAWPAPVLALWRLGLVLLRDEPSRIDDSSRFGAVTRVVVVRSSIGPSCLLKGGPVVLRDAVLEGHAVVVGPTSVVGSGLGHHASVGPFAAVTASFVGPFVKAQLGVSIDGAMVASHVALDGGTHADFLPLGPHAGEGVRVGRQTWIGQHASLVAGAVTGRGVVVAPGTALGRAVPSHRLVAGSPARDLPIDVHVRHLGPEEARRAGREQGPSAAMLPSFGPAAARWRGPRWLELEYPEHVGGAALLQFHAGALEALMAALVPRNPAVVSLRADDAARYDVLFAAACRPHAALGLSTPLAAAVGPDRPPPPDGIPGSMVAALPSTPGELIVAALDEGWFGPLDPSEVASAVLRELRHLGEAGLLTPELSAPIPDAFCRPNVAAIEAALAAGPPPGLAERAPPTPTAPPTAASPTDEARPDPVGRDASAAVDVLMAELRARGVLPSDASPGDGLLTTGRLDSVGWAELVTFVEDAFGVVVTDADLTVATWDRPADVAAMVERRLAP